ncbi:MAG: corrinoid protein [Candidatus Helarchaeota archaeon]|nr:corrinoid protein [Candidatus Helarchaeota archaeon]
MSNLKTLKELEIAVLEGDDDLAQSLAEKAIKEGIPHLSIVNDAIVPGIIEAGEKWKQNEYYLPDVVMSGEAFKMAMEVIDPYLTSEKFATSGKIVIGTVEGDMHSLGKRMVITMLQSAGFDVIDLGVDVPIKTFIDKVKELKPDILGLGCYMSTTMLEIKKSIKILNEEGLRDKVNVMIGGVTTSQEFADECKADAWGKDAVDAAEKAKQLMGIS